MEHAATNAGSAPLRDFNIQKSSVFPGFRRDPAALKYPCYRMCGPDAVPF
jgi:hypothetical protein